MRDALSTRCIGFVGGGNMAEALVRGLLESGASSAAQLRVSEPSEARREHLTTQYGVETTADNASLARWADVVVIAVKPQVVTSAAGDVKDGLEPGDLVICIAAGVPTRTVEDRLHRGSHVVRAMPNTPATVLAGATAVAPGKAATADDLALASALFEAVGRCVVVPESALDAVTGLSGSGPAYIMLVIEALADGGVKAGLPREVALRLAAQTVYGSAKMILDNGDHPGVLKDRVTSPGGTTITGLSRLEAAGVRSAFIEAVVAATERSEELGR